MEIAALDERRLSGLLSAGRGLLAIRDPRPLGLEDVSEHPDSYGFPAHHPRMRSFLGVPVLIRGEPWGNLYLAEKAGGPFDMADEAATVVLSDWAAIAVENARLYEDAARRREEAERAVRRPEASTAIARAVGSETDLERVLELVVKRGRGRWPARGRWCCFWWRERSSASRRRSAISPTGRSVRGLRSGARPSARWFAPAARSGSRM